MTNTMSLPVDNFRSARVLFSAAGAVVWSLNLLVLVLLGSGRVSVDAGLAPAVVSAVLGAFLVVAVRVFDRIDL